MLSLIDKQHASDIYSGNSIRKRLTLLLLMCIALSTLRLNSGGNECAQEWMLVCRKRIGKLRLDDSRYSFDISGILYGRQSCNRFLSITKSAAATRSARAFCHNFGLGIWESTARETFDLRRVSIRLSLHKLLV